MYVDFFRFVEPPFTVTPNPRFLFLSKNHKETFAHLLYGIRNRCGFMEVTGEVGTGKTTVLRTLLDQLDEEDYRLALVFNPSLSSLDLLRAINREFGIAGDGGSEELLSRLNAFLLRENEAGRTVVLVIDEAQNLDPAVLEQIRLLSNLETETDKLIQIVLVGQPELGEVLARTELRQLSQRIVVRYHLQAMDREDAEAYVRHRLKTAGGDPEMFKPGAIRKIYAYSRGLPRLINILADRALVVGFAEGERRITAGMVRTAISELEGTRPKTAAGRLWPVLGVASLVFGGIGYLVGATHPNPLDLWKVPPETAATASVLPSDGIAPDKLPGRAEPKARQEADRVEGPELEELRLWLGSLDEGEDLARAAAALGRAWNMELGEREPPRQLRDFSGTVREQGMHLALFRGDLDGLLNFDSPALLEILLPGVQGARYLALTGADEERVRIHPPPEEGSLLSRELVGRLWSGRAFLPWKNHRGIPPLAQPGAKGEKVARLQELLQAAGAYEAAPSGVYDPETIQAVTRFQGSRGIAQDGRVGPRTLLLLYQAAGSYNVPTIKKALAGGEG